VFDVNKMLLDLTWLQPTRAYRQDVVHVAQP